MVGNVGFNFIAKMGQYRLDGLGYYLSETANRGLYHCFGELIDEGEVFGPAASL